MPTKGSTKFPKASVSVGEVTRVELSSAVSKLDTAIAALPTTATTDAIKTDVTKLKSDLTALDTSKANAADVAKLDTATKELDKAIKDLAALPADVTEAELNAAVAEYNAKLKTANDAIAGVKTSADKAATDITALAATVASNKTAQDASVADTTAKFKTANDAIAAVKTTADKAATDIAALQSAISLDNTGFALSGGALFTAAEAIDKDFVHIKADGKIEVARNTVDSKPADGYVPGTVAVNGTTQVFGTGSKFSVNDFGLVGVPSVARLYLGDGAATLSNTGTNRYFQEIALVRNGTAYLDFTDLGYWVAAT